MSCEKPISTVNLLSKEATSALTNSLPLGEREGGFELVVLVGKKGQIHWYIPNKKRDDKVVQIDTCNGLCFSHEVSTEDPCQGGNQFVVENGFTKRDVSCDADIVKKLTGRTVPGSLVPLAVSVYGYSGCACASGSCIHW